MDQFKKYSRTKTYSLALGEFTGFKSIYEPETIQYKKINKSVWTNLPFFLEADDRCLVDFIGETITFTFLFKKE